MSRPRDIRRKPILKDLSVNPHLFQTFLYQILKSLALCLAPSLRLILHALCSMLSALRLMLYAFNSMLHALCPMPNPFRRKLLFLLLLAPFALCLTPLTNAYSAQVTLTWDPNTETNLAGYKVYCGTASRDYDVTVDVGSQTSYTLSNLEEGKTYYFAVTAYDTSGNESNFSGEVSYDTANADPVNQAPVARPGVLITLDGSNSTDPDDGIASYLWTQTGGMPITLSDPTAVKPSFIAPDVGPGGASVTFQLTVTDGGGLQSTNTFMVTLCSVEVTDVNDAPLAENDSYSVNEGEPLTTDPTTGVLANDSDVENDALTAVLLSDVSYGTLTLNSDGSFTYVHDG
ncbi:MAG: fibronectin type III domain-containing protein, partial [Deltaproteobacteria bacterium]|nr:fibronectin type III domain-containing protein [Deltaproteobacteria bacterium]